MLYCWEKEVECGYNSVTHCSWSSPVVKKQDAENTVQLLASCKQVSVLFKHSLESR